MKPEQGKEYAPTGPWLESTFVGDYGWATLDMTRPPVYRYEVLMAHSVREFERILKAHAPWLDVTGSNQ